MIKKMKEDNEKSFSVLKSRIRHFSKVRKISMREIYDKSGISVGTFSNSSSLSEEALFKMLSCFEELDANWLITGKGDMIKPKAGAIAYRDIKLHQSEGGFIDPVRDEEKYKYLTSVLIDDMYHTWEWATQPKIKHK